MVTYASECRPVFAVVNQACLDWYMLDIACSLPIYLKERGRAARNNFFKTMNSHRVSTVIELARVEVRLASKL